MVRVMVKGNIIGKMGIIILDCMKMEKRKVRVSKLVSKQ